MTVSERPPAKYLVGPLVVRFLAYFLIFRPQTVSRGVEPAYVVEHLQNLFYFITNLFFLVKLFSLESTSPSVWCALMKNDDVHVLSLGCLTKNDDGRVLGLLCLNENGGDRILLSGVPTPSSRVPTPSHRVSLGLMTVSERPPAKYLVGPLVVRFLAYFLILDLKPFLAVSSQRVLADIYKIFLLHRQPRFFSSTYFLLKVRHHPSGVP
jgi:hypothetical protein